MTDHDESLTPDLATDPPRDAHRTAALRAYDAHHEARLTVDAMPQPAFEARLRARVEAAMAASVPESLVASGRDARSWREPLSVGLMRDARRLLPGTALAAAAALLVALAVGPRPALGPDVQALAYAGGVAGAALAGDAALGLPSGAAALMPGGAR